MAVFPLTSWCPRGRFHFLLLFASSTCLHFHILDHLPQLDCPLCHRVAPALSLESWLQDFPYRGHISPENTGLLHVPITILFLPNFWMEFDGPDCNAQPLPKLEVALEQRMLLKLLCSVLKVSVNGGRGCPSLFLPSFC